MIGDGRLIVGLDWHSSQLTTNVNDTKTSRRFSQS